MAVDLRLGRKIKQIREEKGLSQAVLAEKSMIAQSTLSYIEAGKKSPTFETLRAIGDGLGVSILDILKFTDTDGPDKSFRSSDKATNDSLSEEELVKLVELSELIYRKFGKTDS
jgi:transcriptional regulator with XRE-family HTH domain